MTAIAFTDADGFAQSSDQFSIVLLHLSAETIRNHDIATALVRLHVFTDSLENVLRYKESLMFIVDGFDDDPRELAEIPEVRAYFQTLVKQWPHWLWFLHRNVGALSLLLTLLCDVQVTRDPAKHAISTEFTDRHQLGLVMSDLIERSDCLFETYNIAPYLAEASCESAMRDVFP